MANRLTLNGLPPELLLNIMDFLTPTDRASLAISCQSILHLVTRGGEKPLKGLLANQADSEICHFMCRISDDSPEYYLCGVCERLHLRRNVPHPESLRFESICPVSSSLPDYSDTNLASGNCQTLIITLTPPTSSLPSNSTSMDRDMDSLQTHFPIRRSEYQNLKSTGVSFLSVRFSSENMLSESL
jgi:hypothetical protein